jgi:magnesium-transporting ATPase (P-type)
MITSSPIALSLGFERAGPDIMQNPPRSKETSLFTKDLTIDTIVYGTILGGLALVSFIAVPILHKVLWYDTADCIFYGKEEYRQTQVGCDVIYRARYKIMIV